MRVWALAGTLFALALLVGSTAVPDDLPPLATEEFASIGALGPWPPPPSRDPSNRVSGRADAVVLGEALFHSTRLSTVGGLRCASCHAPWRRFTDGRTRALGAADGSRNTPSLLDVRLQHWFGWDGGNDSLWSQSIRPMLDPREMRADAAHVAGALRDDQQLKRLYVQAFGKPPPADDETAMVDVGKALAAFQETLTSERTPFDDYRDALLRGDGEEAARRYPAAAQRGLRLFVGAGRCSACHAGANFSDGEFHASRIASRLPDGSADTGRAHGLATLRVSAYGRGGRFADGAAAAPPRDTRGDGKAGAFRTPSLRGVAVTPPYMHDGSIARLCDAVKPHAALVDGGDAPALELSERRDLVAFLRTLGGMEQPLLVDEDALACP